MSPKRNRYRARVKVKKGAKGSRGSNKRKKQLGSGQSFKWIGTGLGIGVLLFALAWGARTALAISPAFVITRITVEGSSVLRRDEVRQLSAVQRGDYLFGVDLGAVRERIEKEPSIRRAAVTRVLPGTLHIFVDERQPAAQVKAGRRLYLVDAEGVIVPPILKTPDPSLPVILDSGLSRRKARVGRKYVSKKLETSLQLLNALGEGTLPFSGGVRSVHARVLRELWFEVAGASENGAGPGIEIRIGSSGFVRKLELLNEIYQDIKEEINQVKYIDLRFDDVVIGHR